MVNYHLAYKAKRDIDIIKIICTFVVTKYIDV